MAKRLFKNKSENILFAIALVSVLFFFIISIGFVSAQDPYLEASKTAYPLNVSPGENITLTINFIGKGDPTSTRKSLDNILSIDTSGSMDGQKLTGAKNAAKLFVANMNSSLDKVGLVSFATIATLRNNLTNNFTQINNSINSLTAEGYTDLGDGILYSVNELNVRGRNSTLKFIVLLSDGNPNLPTKKHNPNYPIEYALDAAQNASQQGYAIYTIGLGSDVNETLMRQIATITGGKYYFAPTSSELEEIFLNISREFTNIAATNLSVIDEIPGNINFNGPVPDNCDYNSTTKILSCSRSSIAINESWDIIFNVSTNSGGSIRTNGDCFYSYNDFNNTYHEGNLSSPIINVENEAPELSAIGDRLAYVNALLEFNVTATDPNDDNLTYSADNIPSGSSFLDQLFSWIPSIGQGGLYPHVEFSVTDGLLSDSENITITVCEIDEKEQDCVGDGLRQHFFEWNFESCGENYYENISDELCACQVFEESRYCVQDGYANVTYNWNYVYCGSSYSQEEEDMACNSNYSCGDWTNIQNEENGCIENGTATQERLCVDQYDNNYSEYRNVSQEECNCLLGGNPLECINIGLRNYFFEWNYGYCGADYYNNVSDPLCECIPQENQSQSCGNGGTQIRFCSENYTWGEWQECTGEQSGGGGGSCTPRWSCSDWSSCINNLNTRTCTDLKKCNKNMTMPELTQSCVSNDITYSHCAENWTCVAVGECMSDGTQELSCTDANKCGTENIKPSETQSCSYQEPVKKRTGITGAVIGALGDFPWWIALIALLLVLALLSFGISETRKANKKGK